jgi:pimeloyl-ACP methyl ester carboxylesterase
VVAEVRRRGAEAVVLLGNSGGGSLMALAQAERGDLGDAFVAVAAHPGEGVFMLKAIDPSVTDEDDPFSCDRSLDMYDPDNGWHPWPEPSRYDGDWLARYRTAQRERVARIDAGAQASLAARDEARGQVRNAAKGSREWNGAARRAFFGRYLTIYRTLANPAYLDLSIDPDDRDIGTVFAFPDPLLSNYGYFGLARVMTDRGWLSTWSGLSSKAEMAHTLPRVTIPTLVVHATGDTEITISEARGLYESSGATNKAYVEIKGAPHYLHGHRREAIEIVVDWLQSRVP